MAVQALLVAAFWSSLVVVGGAVLLCIRRYKALRGVTVLVAAMPLAAQIFVSFSAAMVVFAPWIVLGYLFALPLKVLSIVYGLMILASLVYWWRERQAIWNRVRTIRPRKSWLFFASLVLVGLLAADYVWSLYIGAFIANGNDAYVHMGKIEQLAHGNMTLSDPYFSGVIESRYHLNFVHVLNAIGTQRLHMETIDFWSYSYPFFRTMSWLGIFTLAWYFSPIRNRRLFAAGSTAVSMALLVSFMSSANYPNVIVLAWIGLFIIGLSQFVTNRGGWLMLASALLIGMTHPAYGVGTAGFLLLLSAYIALFERSWITKRRIGAVVASLGLLMWPAALAAFFPNRLSEQTFGFGTTIMHVTNSVVILHPPVPHKLTWPLIVALLSFVGYAAFIKTRKERRDKVLVGLLVIYFALVAYNPVVSFVAGKQLPPWMIERFQYINRLSTIAAVAGIIFVVRTLVIYVPKQQRRIAGVIATIILLIPLYNVSVLPFQTYKASHLDNRHQFIYIHNVEKLSPALHDQQIFATKGDSFQLPSVTTMGLVSMPDTNASPVANMALRQACADYLGHTLDSNALATAGITRVMVPAWEPEMMKLAKTKSYLRPVAGNSDFIVYDFVMPHHHKTVGVCNIPHGQ